MSDKASMDHLKTQSFPIENRVTMVLDLSAVRLYVLLGFLDTMKPEHKSEGFTEVSLNWKVSTEAELLIVKGYATR